jgi:hypothetical protein
VEDEPKPSEHVEPPPPNPPPTLHQPAVYSYNAGLGCPFCGEHRRRVMGKGRRKVVVCFGCYEALWPVVGDASKRRETNQGQGDLL